MAATVEASEHSVRPGQSDSSPLGWLSQPTNRYVAIGATVAAVLLIGWFIILSGQRKESFGLHALDQARSVAEGGNLAQAASDLQKVITTYAGTKAAQEAVITLNQVRLINGQHELAVVGLQDFLKSGPEAEFRAPGQGLLGRALENAKRPAEAAAAYLAASAAADVDYLKASYLLDAARSYADAGDREKAIATYRQLLKDFGTTNSRTEAEIRLSELTQGQM